MPRIDELCSVDAVSASDLVPVYDASAGDARKVSVGSLLGYFLENFVSPEFTKQTSAPSSSGFTVTVDDDDGNVWLLLSPVADYATGTVRLPDEPHDGQQVLITTTKRIGDLNINGNGADVSAESGGLQAGGACLYRYEEDTETWFLIADAATTGANVASGDASFRAANGDLAIEGNNVTIDAPSGDVTITSVSDVTVTGDEVFSIINFSDVLILAAAGTILGVAGGAQLTMTLGRTITSKPIQISTVTVASLPAVTGLAGARATVSDANATTFNSIVAGGGANVVPVFCDGTNWRIG